MKKSIILILSLFFFGVSFICAEESSDVLKQANEQITKNNLPKAISMLEGVVEKRKDIYEAFYLLGKAYYMNNEFEKAEKNLLKSVELNKSFTPPYLLLANIYDKRNKLDDATAILNKALDVDAANGLLYAKLGEISFRNGKEDDSIKAFLKSYQFDKTLSSSVREAARIYIKNRNYDTALDLLNRTLKELPPGGEAESSFKGLVSECRYSIIVKEAEKQYEQRKINKALSLYEEAFAITNKDPEIVVKMASCCHIQKNDIKAEEFLKKAIEDAPATASAWRLKAVMANDRHDLPAAEEAVLKAVELDAGRASTFELAGNIYEQLGSKEKARKYYGQAVIIDENDMVAHARYGYLLADDGRYEESIKQLEAAQAISPSADKRELLQTVKSFYYIDLGNKAFDQKQYKEAADNYDKSLKFKKSTTASINKANANIEAGNFDEAISILKGVTSEKDKFLPAFESLGIAYQKAGKTKEAEAVYKSMQAAAKDDPIVYANTAKYYHQNMNYAKAITNYTKAIKFSKDVKLTETLNASLSRSYYGLGVDFYEQKNYDSAADCFTNALVADHSLADARAALVRIKYVRDMNQMNDFLAQASAYYSQKEYGKAAELYKKVLDISDDIKSAKFNLAGCYYSMNNYAQAELLLKDYMLANPDDTEAIYLLAQVYIDQNDLVNAKSLLSRSIEKGRESARIAYYLGSLYEKDGNIKDAEQQYLRAIRIDPNDLEARLNLGNIYYKRGDYSKSQEQYENVLRISPENDAAIYNLGFIYYKKNRIPEALAQFKKAENYIKNYAPLFFNIARANFYAGNYAEAIRYGEMAGAQEKTPNTLYNWGLANIYVRMFASETDPKKKEDYRTKAIKLCEDCIFNKENAEISMMARAKIVEVRPDRKYLYKAQYFVDKKFTPQIIENVLYTYIERDGAFVKSYKETGEVIWSTKVRGKPSAQYRVGRNFYAVMGGDVVIIDIVKGTEIGRFGVNVAELIPCPEGLLVAETGGASFSYYKGTKKEWGQNLPVVNSTPSSVIFTEQKVFLFNTAKVVCIETETGKKLWDYSSSESTILDLNAFKNMTVIGTASGDKKDLLCLNPEDGKLLWSAQMKDGFQTKPVMDYDKIVCFLKDNSVVCFNNVGKQLWTKKLPQQVLSGYLQNGLVFVSMKNDMLSGLDMATGTEVWKYAIDKEKMESGSLYTIYYLE